MIFFPFVLQKHWEALIRRATTRASGLQPPRRGKHWKSKKEASGMETSIDVNIEDVEKDDTISENDENNDKKLVLKNLNYETLFVETSTDLKSLFESHFQERPENLGLMGLHTCGNLAPSSLRIFLENSDIKFCCNVGCCYHHLDEEFYVNPYLKQSENSDEVIVPGFPMSSVLKNMKYSLGRNPRMIAAQPMDRLITNKQVSHIIDKKVYLDTAWKNEIFSATQFFFSSNQFTVK